MVFKIIQMNIIYFQTCFSSDFGSGADYRVVPVLWYLSSFIKYYKNCIFIGHR